MNAQPCITNCNNYIKKYVTDLNNLNKFAKYMVSPSARDIIKQFFSNYDENAVLSIFAYPVDLKELFINTGGIKITLTSIKYLTATTEAQGYDVDIESINQRHEGGIFELTRRHNDYLDYAPYTKMQLYLPCVGVVDIDPAMWYDKTIHIYYAIDFENGGITYTICNETDNIDYGGYSGQYGVEMAVTSSRMGEIKTQAVTGTITGAIEMLAGNIAGGAIDMTSSAMSWFNAPAGVKGGKSGQGIAHGFDENAPFIIETYFEPVESDEKFAAARGLPLYAWRDFETLAGYTVIDEVHLEGFAIATEGERQEIESLLKNGVHM